MRLIHPQMNVAQPVLVWSLALAAWVYVAMAAGPLVPVARAGAITNAYGGGAKIDVLNDLYDPESGYSLAHDMGNNGSWAAEAIAVGPDGTVNVTLKAMASATWGGAASNQHPGGAAFAEWTDRLTFKNPEVLDLREFSDLFVRFPTSVDGRISGAGNARYTLTLNGQGTGSDFDAPGLNIGNFELPVPSNYLITGLNLTMTLYATASTTPGSLNSEADFSSTAVLPQLTLADANGNYVPGTEQLRIVGASGFEYSVAAVPEPATAALLALGGVSLLSFWGHRRRIG
jgi:hypothetical protein